MKKMKILTTIIFVLVLYCESTAASTFDLIRTTNGNIITDISPIQLNNVIESSSMFLLPTSVSGTNVQYHVQVSTDLNYTGDLRERIGANGVNGPLINNYWFNQLECITYYARTKVSIDGGVTWGGWSDDITINNSNGFGSGRIRDYQFAYDNVNMSVWASVDAYASVRNRNLYTNYIDPTNNTFQQIDGYKVRIRNGDDTKSQIFNVPVLNSNSTTGSTGGLSYVLDPLIFNNDCQQLWIEAKAGYDNDGNGTIDKYEPCYGIAKEVNSILLTALAQPIDGATAVPLTTTFQSTPIDTTLIDSVDWYFSVDPSFLNNPISVLNNNPNVEHTTKSLSLGHTDLEHVTGGTDVLLYEGTTYYVKIISHTITGTAKSCGEIYSFTTDGIYNPINSDPTNYYNKITKLYKKHQGNNKILKQIDRSNTIWGSRLYPHGNMNVAATAISQYYQNTTSSSSSMPFPIWNEIGGKTAELANGQFTGFTGQIHCIEFDPSYGVSGNQTVYAGSPYGGLWKSLDDGLTWKNLTDYVLPINSVSDIAINPTNGNELLICTGNADGYTDVSGSLIGSSNPVFSSGVYRSNNGGDSWEQIGNSISTFSNGALAGYVCRNIVLNPSNPNIAIVSTSKGIFRSNDAFNSPSPIWSPVLNPGGSFDQEFKTIRFDPIDPNIVYCSGKEIYKSTDAGLTWGNPISGQSSVYDIDWSTISNLNFIPKRIDLSITQNYIYIYAVGDEKITTVNTNRTASSYVLRFDGNITSVIEKFKFIYGISINWMNIEVNPADENDLFFGNTSLYHKTYDSGTNTWGNSRAVGQNNSNGHHMDVHEIRLSPTGELWSGNDGGISVKTGNLYNSDGWIRKNDGLNVSTIWGFDDTEDNTGKLIIGMQDNGVSYTNDNGSTWNSVHHTDPTIYWTNVTIGDGGACHIDDNDENSMYYVVWPGHKIYNVDPTTNSSTLQNFWTSSCIPNGGSFHGLTKAKGFKMQNHPSNVSELYFSMSEITKRVSPTSFKKVSDIHKTAPIRKPWEMQITDFEICKADPNVIYSLFGGGYPQDEDVNLLNPTPSDMSLEPLFVKSITGFNDLWCNDPNYPTTNKFMDYTTFLPSFNGTFYDVASSEIAVNPNNEDELWMTFHGYNEDYKVWMSLDGGETPKNGVNGVSWQNMDPNHDLPNLPVNSIVYDDQSSTILIGTDVGVYIFKGDLGNTSTYRWEKYGNIPNVRITGMKVNNTNRKLRVSTFGRGVWEADLPCPSTYNSTPIVITRNPKPNNGYFTDASTFNGVNQTIDQDIIVKNQAYLVIQNSTLSFMPDVKIIVEAGGYLDIDNSTLTSLECLAGKMWQGIQVLGDPNASNPQDDGIVNAKNSTIEYARNAIRNHRNYSWGTDQATVGGVVQATNTKFLNNRRSVSFIEDQSQYAPTESFFDQCQFELNDNYSMNSVLPMVSQYQVLELKFMGNSFEDNRTNILDQDRATGVFSADGDCEFTATQIGNAPVRNTFSNLLYGIHYSADGQWGYFLKVDNASFNNTQRGIYNVGSQESIFKNNYFDIPVFDHSNSIGVSNEQTANYGIYTHSLYDAVIENNKMYSNFNIDNSTYGLVMNNSLSALNPVNSNVFNGLSIATQFEGDNSGATLECNKYVNYNYAIAIVDNTNTLASFMNQGTSCSTNDLAKNKFSPSAVSTAGIYSDVAFTYHHRGDYGTLTTIGITVPPCSPPAGGAQSLACVSNSGNGGARASGIVSPPSLETMMLELDDSNFEESEMKRYYSILVNSNKDDRPAYKLNESELDELELIIKGGSEAALQAEKLITLNTNKVFHHNPVKFKSTKGKNTIINYEVTTNKELSNIKVQPNPFTNTINVKVETSKEETLNITISDLVGKIMYTSNNHTTNSNIKIGEALENGMYLMQLSYGKEVESVKIIKQ